MLNYKLLLFLFLGFSISCVSPKKITYFQTKEGQEWHTIQAIANEIELTIQPGDALLIALSSFDPEAIAPFIINNRQFGQNNFGGQATYVVNKAGYIEFPVLDTVKVNGLKINELRDKLIKEVKAFVNDPVVSVRFSELKVTILGEVSRRGVISSSRDRLSIIEAIGMAGDITEYGNRSNVLLIREEDGVRRTARINLLTVDVFNSPFYYLKPNDIIYVEPNKRKSVNLSSAQTSRVLSLVTGVTSLTALLIALFRS